MSFTEFAATMIPIHQFIDSLVAGYPLGKAVERVVGERVVAAFHSHDVRTPEFRVDTGGEIVTNLAGLPWNAELGDRPLLETRTGMNATLVAVVAGLTVIAVVVFMEWS